LILLQRTGNPADKYSLIRCQVFPSSLNSVDNIFTLHRSKRRGLAEVTDSPSQPT